MARRKRYSAEFKRQALKRADEPGVTDALVCEELGISTTRAARTNPPATVPAMGREAGPSIQSTAQPQAVVPIRRSQRSPWSNLRTNIGCRELSLKSRR